MEPFFTKRANEHLMLVAIVIRGLVICNVDQNVTQKIPVVCDDYVKYEEA